MGEAVSSAVDSPPREAPKVHPKARRRRTPWFDWMIAPTVVVLAVVIAYPVVRSVMLSGSEYNTISGFPPRGVGLDNYRELFTSGVFWTALRNTVVYTFGSVAVACVVGAGLALLTENLVGRFRVAKALLLTPWAVPFVVVAFLFRYMFEEQNGIINEMLTDLGIIDQHVPWLASSTWAMPSVMVANIWVQTPFFLLIFSAALAAVPNEVIEAARVDRARVWSMVRSIKLPYMRNAGMVAVLLMVIANFNDFEKIWAMTEGGPAYSTTTLVVYVYREAFQSFNLGYASAVGVVWLLLLLVFAVFYVRRMQRTT